MDRIATDCDVLIYQCLTIRELLAVRGCSRALVARYGPARDTLWEAVRPTRERLLDQLSASPLALVKLLDAAYDFTTDRAGMPAAFRLVCARGRTLTAQWLADRARMARRSPTTTGALGCACANGHLRTAQWLTGRFGLTTADARSLGNHALNGAYLRGFAPVVEWLVETFELTAQDAAVELGYGALLGAPLWNACANGHIAIAQYLVKRLKVTATYTHQSRALHVACRNGHLAIVQWLTSTRLARLRTDGVDALIAACENGTFLWLSGSQRGSSSCPPMLVNMTISLYRSPVRVDTWTWRCGLQHSLSSQQPMLAQVTITRCMLLIRITTPQ